MSPDTGTPRTRRLWCATYVALLRVLPQTLRERHGEAMRDLYARELARRGPDGLGQESIAALAGLADLVGRGVHERVAAERRAMGSGDLRQLRALVRGFALACGVLTTLLVGLAVRTRLHGHADARAFALVVYTVPYTLALTVPMAVFLAVLRASARWGGAGSGTVTGGDREASPRLTPVLAFGALMALLSFPLTAEVVPRTNARLQAVIVGHATPPNDRSLPLGALRERVGQLARQVANGAAVVTDGEGRAAEAAPGTTATYELRTDRRRLASSQVELHKKFAVPAACLLLAFLGAGLARRVPGLGVGRQLLACATVFLGYWLVLMAGESLAEQLVMSPALAMWSANGMALLGALVAFRTAPPSGQGVPRRRATPRAAA
jgi:hypothetical protein